MYAGGIIEFGIAENVLKHPSHPYTAALLLSRPRLDRDRGQKLASITGAPPDLFAPPKGCGFFDRCEAAMEVCRDNLPEFFELDDSGHRSLCWLHHPFGREPRDSWLAGREAAGA
jgi:oligopeptide transport system ATP-binding protein